MRARDVMVSPVIAVMPSCPVEEVAKTLLERGISGVPVVDSQGRLVGIVSEGDLLHRSETDTERKRSWWLRLLTDGETLAAEYTKAHARKVEDVMTRDVVTAGPDTPLNAIAMLLEKHAIKRVPIVQDGQLIGIVSRANLIQAVASGRPEAKAPELGSEDPRATADSSADATVGSHAAAERHRARRRRGPVGHDLFGSGAEGHPCRRRGDARRSRRQRSPDDAAALRGRVRDLHAALARFRSGSTRASGRRSGLGSAARSARTSAAAGASS